MKADRQEIENCWKVKDKNEVVKKITRSIWKVTF